MNTCTKRLIAALLVSVLHGQWVGAAAADSAPKAEREAAIKAIIKELRTRVPEMKILVLAIFPRCHDDGDALRTLNMATNKIIATIAGDVFGKHVQAYLKDFLFDPKIVDTKVGTLSGGERSRLLLAREFARTSNLLVLDEPTNDLDLETLDLLQEVIADYDGTVLIVSHDRDFLDRTVTVTLGLDGSGRLWTIPPYSVSVPVVQVSICAAEGSFRHGWMLQGKRGNRALLLRGHPAGALRRLRPDGGRQ